MLSRCHIALRRLGLVFGLILTIGNAQAVLAQNPGWSINPPDFEQSMNVVGTLTINGAASANTNDQIAAFVGSEIRGVASPLSVSGTQYFFLTVYANGGSETISFKTYDATNDRVVDITETVTFVANGVEGTLGSPFTWTATGTALPAPSVPALQTPTNGATNQATTVTLQWGTVANATSYDVQLATTNTFLAPLMDRTGVTTTQTTSPTLTANTTYFWRVRAVGSGGTSAWSTPFSFTTSSGATAPGIPTLLSPANGAVNQPVALALTWTVSPNTSTYDVEVATDAAFSAVVFSRTGLTNTTVSPTGLTNDRIYHWRVRGVGSGGTGAWSPTASFRTVALSGAPAIPILASPSNQSTDVFLPVTIAWEAAANTASYDVQLSAASDFSSVLLEERNLATVSLQLNDLAHNLTYYWRVRSVSASGAASAWSAHFRFSTAPPAPSIPVLVAPANQTTDLDTVSVILDWNSAFFATTHDLQVATDEAFSNLVVDARGLTEFLYTLRELDRGVTYYWRVRGVGGGGTSEWADAFWFSTIPAPEAPTTPVLALPEDQAVDQPLDAFLDWRTALHATSYELQIATNVQFSSTVVSRDGVPNSFYRPTGLAFSTTYFWRVRAMGPGGVSNWSSTFSFSTLAPPPAPVAPLLQAPLDQAVDQIVPLALSWAAATHAVRYDVQVATSSAFATRIVDAEGVTGLEQVVETLEPSTTYHWRVRASGSGGTSAWSAAFRFTTAAVPPPGAPTLQTPANRATDQEQTVSLTWTTVDGALRYDLQLATTNTFVEPVLDVRDHIETTYQVSDLAPRTAYFWRVRAVGDAGIGTWSDVFRFDTRIPAPGLPVLQAPLNGATSVLLAPSMEWGAAEDASRYDVQVATGDAFTALVVDRTGLTETSFVPSGLLAETTYFWRVRGQGDGGTGAWTAPFSFTTAAEEIGVPVLLQPSNGTQVQSANATLTWQALGEAASYEIQLAQVEDFSSVVLQVSGISETSFIASDLALNTTYFWRARVTGGEWSAPFAFTTTTIPVVVAVPILQAPVNGTREQDLDVRLAWAAAENAVSYEIQVALTNTFSATSISKTDIATTHLDIDNLASETTYFWRVRGRNGVSVSAWSLPFEFATRASLPLPEPPSLVAPRNGLALSETSVRLSWQSAENGVRYHVQVATDFRFQTLVAEQTDLVSSALLVNDLISGNYAWRVRAEGVGGFSVWSEVFQFSISGIALPDSPLLQRPSNQQVGVARSVDLVWTNVDGASSYEAQVATDEGFSDIIAQWENLSDVQVTSPNLAVGTTYFWRVRSRSSAGASAWATPFQFTTEQGAQQLAAPILTAPANGATARPVDVRLVWSTVTEAAGYDVQVATDIDYQNVTLDQVNVAGTFLDANSLAHGTTYFWRVRSRRSDGQSTWSESFSFATIGQPTPSVPVLATPVDGAIGQALDVVLQGQVVPGAETYHVQVATDIGFSALIVDQQDLVNVSLTMSGASYEITYFWRARAMSAGGVSAWSNIRSFTTIARPDAPSVPVLAAPIDGAIDQPVEAVLVWLTSDRAKAYDVQVASNPDFASPLVDVTGVTATTFVTDALRPVSTYFWRIRSHGDGGKSIWSSAFRFTTASLPGNVALTFPKDSATNLPPAILLRWGAVEDATGYEVQVATFGAVVAEASNIPDIQHMVEGLTPGTTYNWRVRALGPGGAGAWSLPFRFTVATLPDALALLIPLDRAGDQPTDARLEWEVVSNAVQYDLQVGIQADFTQLHAAVDGLTDNQHTVQGLAANTTYYWRARAISLAGEGTWSTIRRFTTGLPIPTTAPTPVGPRNGDIVSGTDPIFVWSPIPATTTYRFQIATDPSFSEPGNARQDGADAATIVVDTSGLTEAFFVLPPGILDYNTTYYWRTQGLTVSGAGPWGAVFSLRTPVGTSTEDTAVPTEFALADNYPNPFNPTTTIEYRLPVAEHVTLTVFDMLGREIHVLVDQTQTAGTHTHSFDAVDLPSGMYLYRLQAGRFVATKQMLLVK